MVGCNLVGIILTLCIGVHLSDSYLTIESPGSFIPQEYDCDKLTFPKVEFITCVCVKGIWAFLIKNINNKNQQTEWKLLGGDTDKSKCYQLGQWVSQIRRISTLSTKSSMKILKGKSNVILVTNNQTWQINLIDEHQQKQKICLSGAKMNEYCIYKIQPTLVQERSIVKECSTDSIMLKAIECEEFSPSIVDDEPFVCDLVPPKPVFSRQKRQAAVPVPQYQNNEVDEDFVSEERKALKRGNTVMMNAIIEYIRLAVAKILELSNGRTKRSTITPVATLLRISNDIMKKICAPVNNDVFNVALESFIKLQRDTYHIKEPYIPYAASVRILNALEKCSAWSQPHMFTREVVKGSEDFYCDTAIPGNTSKTIIINGQNESLVDLPLHSIANPEAHDPVVETVWKAFLSAHSYCYKFFEDYFNDHHTLTVSLMPFFTNQIQQIWFINGSNETPPDPPKYETKNIWYGNILGNVGQLFRNIDNCYGASRLYSDYPWYLKRPPLEGPQTPTKRRKRSLLDHEHVICN